MATKKNEQIKGRTDGLVAENRRSRREYSVEDTLEAGIMLVGSEVKSLREGRANIAESYASVEQGELWLINAEIQTYGGANRFNHEPRRKRKLLVSKRQLAKLSQEVERLSIVAEPLDDGEGRRETPQEARLRAQVGQS